MIKAFAAIALSLATTVASLAADADPYPIAPPRSVVPSLAPILKKITPAVVNIEARGRMAPDPKGRRRAPREFNSVGSGVIYDAQQGLIVTNDHVLEHANEITVILTDGRLLKAKRVGGDPISISPSFPCRRKGSSPSRSGTLDSSRSAISCSPSAIPQISVSP
jgi:S1-C subfamily serine protease